MPPYLLLNAILTRTTHFSVYVMVTCSQACVHVTQRIHDKRSTELITLHIAGLTDSRSPFIYSTTAEFSGLGGALVA